MVWRGGGQHHGGRGGVGGGALAGHRTEPRQLQLQADTIISIASRLVARSWSLVKPITEYENMTHQRSAAVPTPGTRGGGGLGKYAALRVS